jgi:N-acetylmuramoyl-L-alanine amidase
VGALGLRPHAAAGDGPSARTLYERAVGLDRELRAAMAQTHPAKHPTARQMRTVITAYRTVVWRHPTSGYCDNALWQAALLSIEAFDRFGQEADRQAALTLMRDLVREYPASSFVRRAKATIARVEQLAAHAVAAPPAGTPAKPGPEPRLVIVEQVSRASSLESTDVVVQLSGPAAFRAERIEHPARVFVDVMGTRPAEAVKDAILSFQSGLVRQVRVGRHPNAVTRIVVDAEGVNRHAVRLATDPDRLIITCWASPAPPAPASAPAITPLAAAPTVTPTEPTRATTPPALTGPPATPVMVPSAASAPTAPAPRSETDAEGTAPPATPPATPPAAPPAAAASNVRGGFSLARQLGLGVSRIVIDPGHGGHDPGALLGTRTEAAITLDIALRLEALLLKQPGIEVVLTRRTDIFVTLQERTEIANREAADLFVSIHVNASRNSAARGVETYLLDFASTPDAAAVAARENASSMLTMNDLNDLVKRITLTSKADESRDLAVTLQGAMVRNLRKHNSALRDLGVKRAPFVVLIGASMPSVLVEVAFLTHKQEGRLLANSGYRQRVAESLSDGVRRYLQALKPVSPVGLRPDDSKPAASTGGTPGRLPLQ